MRSFVATLAMCGFCLWGCSTTSPSSPQRQPSAESVVQMKTVSGRTTSKYLCGDTAVLSWNGPPAATPGATVLLSVDSGATWAYTMQPLETLTGGYQLRTVMPVVVSEPVCMVMVTDETDTALSSTFALKGLLAVEPVAGAVYHPGDTLVVRWRAHFTTTNVAAVLWPNNVEIMAAYASTTVDMHEWPAMWPRFYWVIPQGVTCEACYVEVADYMEQDPHDRTEGTFRIVAP